MVDVVIEVEELIILDGGYVVSKVIVQEVLFFERNSGIVEWDKFVSNLGDIFGERVSVFIQGSFVFLVVVQDFLYCGYDR